MIKDTMFDNDYYALFVEQGSGKMAINALNALPTHREESQRTQGVGSVGWIPCSERLPGERDPYEVLCCDVRGEQIIAHIYESDESNTGYSAESDDTFMVDCIAWMPLPEPWKGADDDNK